MNAPHAPFIINRPLLDRVGSGWMVFQSLGHNNEDSERDIDGRQRLPQILAVYKYTTSQRGTAMVIVTILLCTYWAHLLSYRQWGTSCMHGTKKYGNICMVGKHMHA